MFSFYSIDKYKKTILELGVNELENDKRYLIQTEWTKIIEDNNQQSSLSEDWRYAKTFGDQYRVIVSFITKKLGVDKSVIEIEGVALD